MRFVKRIVTPKAGEVTNLLKLFDQLCVIEVPVGDTVMLNKMRSKLSEYHEVFSEKMLTIRRQFAKDTENITEEHPNYEEWDRKFMQLANEALEIEMFTIDINSLADADFKITTHLLGVLVQYGLIFDPEEKTSTN